MRNTRKNDQETDLTTKERPAVTTKERSVFLLLSPPVFLLLSPMVLLCCQIGFFARSFAVAHRFLGFWWRFSPIFHKLMGGPQKNIWCEFNEVWGPTQKTSKAMVFGLAPYLCEVFCGPP